MARTPELGERVTLAAPVVRDEVRRAQLAAADALVSPAEPRGSETLDKVVYEAAACGVPVVARRRSAGVPRRPPGGAELHAGRRGGPGPRPRRPRRGGPGDAAGDQPRAAPPRGRAALARHVADEVAAVVAEAAGASWSAWRHRLRSRRSFPRPGRPCGTAVRPRAGAVHTLSRRVLEIATLATLDAVGLALGLSRAPAAGDVVGDEIFWSWPGRPGRRNRSVPRAHHLARLLASQALRGPGSAQRPRPRGFLADPRRGDRARVRARHRLGADVGLIPTAFVTCTIVIGLLRAAYDSFTAELRSAFCTRVPAPWCSGEASLATLTRLLTFTRAGSRTSSSARSRRSRPRPPPSRIALAEAGRGDPRGRLRRAGRSRDRRDRAPHRRSAPVAEAACSAPRRVGPGGVPLLSFRPPVLAGADSAIKKSFDLVASALVVAVSLHYSCSSQQRSTQPHRPRSPTTTVASAAGNCRCQVSTRRRRRPAAGQAQGATTAAHSSNSRKTPVHTRGHTLRRLSIDQLPRVLNILHDEVADWPCFVCTFFAHSRIAPRHTGSRVSRTSAFAPLIVRQAPGIRELPREHVPLLQGYLAVTFGSKKRRRVSAMPFTMPRPGTKLMGASGTR